ncbi:MAG: addiction module protein [Planctomycetota bacterium]
MTRTEQIAADALALTPAERVVLVDRVLESLDKVDPELDSRLAAECESRLSAYDRGEIRAVPLREALSKYMAQ